MTTEELWRASRQMITTRTTDSLLFLSVFWFHTSSLCEHQFQHSWLKSLLQSSDRLTSPRILSQLLDNTAFTSWFKTELNRFCVLIGLRERFIVNIVAMAPSRGDTMMSLISVSRTIWKWNNFLVTVAVRYNPFNFWITSKKDTPSCRRDRGRGKMGISCTDAFSKSREWSRFRHMNESNMKWSRSECYSHWTCLQDANDI